MYDKLNHRDLKCANTMDTFLPYDDYHEAQRIAYQLSDNYLDKTNNHDFKESCAIDTPFSHSVQKGIIRATLNVTISGIPGRALCDTGSNYTHVSGTFAKKLYDKELETTTWNRCRLYAVNGREVTPRRQFDNLKIESSELNFTGYVDVGIIREQSFDLIIGMDLMCQIGLVILTPISTLTLMSELEECLTKKNDIKHINWKGNDDPRDNIRRGSKKIDIKAIKIMSPRPTREKKTPHTLKIIKSRDVDPSKAVIVPVASNGESIREFRAEDINEEYIIMKRDDFQNELSKLKKIILEQKTRIDNFEGDCKRNNEPQKETKIGSVVVRNKKNITPKKKK